MSSAVVRAGALPVATWWATRPCRTIPASKAWSRSALPANRPTVAAASRQRNPPETGWTAVASQATARSASARATSFPRAASQDASVTWYPVTSEYSKG